MKKQGIYISLFFSTTGELVKTPSQLRDRKPTLNTSISLDLRSSNRHINTIYYYFVLRRLSLVKPERNYCDTREVLLANVKSVEDFHQYLNGRKFLIRTDHASLRWLLNFKGPESQIACWIRRL
ncbi:hypothetical protein AVEN_69453-1 [Araneus ventricosus]|uniref:Reverse transcriptase RNase H-like domain-containing protein n=1 Tax=Araneus ventricosus TaxID=182803 RepID=A0A4Y2T5T8_ARAVE|nr:hypothetical protein AVEN_243982-1 [Araneus ventricosus]GBN94511.1 hypothetical protein AVEN_271581-1 [Araneus ventricosus]GBN94514.1 hypothetical protein AVEN_136181-1 [Araneus ventricosus]GBN94526.1 hypothetical protein AVEN_69453-1 [Araneus ventricosus]